MKTSGSTFFSTLSSHFREFIEDNVGKFPWRFMCCTKLKIIPSCGFAAVRFRHVLGLLHTIGKALSTGVKYPQQCKLQCWVKLLTITLRFSLTKLCTLRTYLYPKMFMYWPPLPKKKVVHIQWANKPYVAQRKTIMQTPCLNLKVKKNLYLYQVTHAHPRSKDLPLRVDMSVIFPHIMTTSVPVCRPRKHKVLP